MIPSILTTQKSISYTHTYPHYYFKYGIGIGRRRKVQILFLVDTLALMEITREFRMSHKLIDLGSGFQNSNAATL